MHLTIELGAAEAFAASDDIQSILDLEGTVMDLSPAFRRLLFDLDEALTQCRTAAGLSSMRDGRV